MSQLTSVFRFFVYCIVLNLSLIQVGANHIFDASQKPVNSSNYQYHLNKDKGFTIYQNALKQQTLTYLDSLITRDTLVICNGDSIEIFGEWAHAAADYEITYSHPSGIDCTHITTLNVVDTLHTYEHIDLCAGHFIKIGNQVIDTGGTYTLELTSQAGCDSLHTMIVSEIDTIFTRDTMWLCLNDSLEINGLWVHQAGDYISTYIAASGCDSTHTTHVELLDAVETSETIRICFGESAEIFGTFQTASGLFLDTLTAQTGCDSIHMVELVVLDSIIIDWESGFMCRDENDGWINVQVSGGLAPYEYEWNLPAITESGLQNLSEGHYMLTVTDAQGCITNAEIVLQLADFNLLEMNILESSCYGYEDGEITIVPLVSNLQFSLNGLDYQEELTFSNLGVGTHTLYILDDNDCVYEETFEVYQPNEIHLYLPPDTTIRFGQSLTIYPSTNASYIELYEWTPQTSLNCENCAFPTATPQEESAYQLTITDDNGCTASDWMTIFVDQTPQVYIPNAFSPNADGDNDVFMIFSNPVVTKVNTFRLFDRWGELLYQADNFPPNEPIYGWDGYFRNILMSVGVYAYFAEVELLNGEKILYKGDVNLIR